jgi:hypothetical protein
MVQIHLPEGSNGKTRWLSYVILLLFALLLLAVIVFVVTTTVYEIRH